MRAISQSACSVCEGGS